MKATGITRIDDRCRTGCMTGLVKPGEHYIADKPTPTEIRLRLLVEPKSAPARLVRKNGRTLLVNDWPVTNEDVQAAMVEFP